jgi:hypothetical protein
LLLSDWVRMNAYVAKSQLHIPYCKITSSCDLCTFVSHFHFTTYESECHPFCMLTSSSSYVFSSTLVLIYIRAIWTWGTAAPYDRNWLFLLYVLSCMRWVCMHMWFYYGWEVKFAFLTKYMHMWFCAHEILFVVFALLVCRLLQKATSQ